jgi:hypothetical protein
MRAKMAGAIGYGAADAGAMVGETEDDLAPWLAVKKAWAGAQQALDLPLSRHIALIGCKFAECSDVPFRLERFTTRWRMMCSENQPPRTAWAARDHRGWNHEWTDQLSTVFTSLVTW